MGGQGKEVAMHMVILMESWLAALRKVITGMHACMNKHMGGTAGMI